MRLGIPRYRPIQGWTVLIIALLVIGNGRLSYLADTIDAALEHLPTFDHYLMVDDSGDRTVQHHLNRTYPDFHIHSHGTNLGMAKAVQAGWGMVLETDTDYVFHLEEDFRVLHPIPIDAAVTALETNTHVAQMLFQRQPLTPDEEAAGSVLGAMGPVTPHDNWCEQRHIFSLKPCLINRRVLKLGWPAGNEKEMTDQLLYNAWTFGVWHGQHVEHIGTNRGTKWQL